MILYSYIWNPQKGVGVADHNCMKCNQIFMPMTVYTGSSTIMSPPKPTEI